MKSIETLREELKKNISLYQRSVNNPTFVGKKNASHLMNRSEVYLSFQQKNAIKCPYCENLDTKQIFEDERQFIYRCNNCSKETIIDIVDSHNVQVNGKDSVVEFVENK